MNDTSKLIFVWMTQRNYLLSDPDYKRTHTRRRNRMLSSPNSFSFTYSWKDTITWKQVSIIYATTEAEINECVWYFSFIESSFWRERKMKFSGPTLTSLASFHNELGQLWCSFSAGKACLRIIKPDNKLHAERKSYFITKRSTNLKVFVS